MLFDSERSNLKKNFACMRKQINKQHGRLAPAYFAPI